MSMFSGIGGSALGRVLVEVGLDARPLEQQMGRTKGYVKGEASTMGNTMATAIKAGAVLAGAAVVKFGADSVRAYSEAQIVANQTNAVIESTGGVANVTADDVKNLGQSIADYSGINDEAVQASENLLLTFRDIRNEAGKGNDIFNQTEAAITDMATAMNQGVIPSQEQLKQVTIQVGKAMNDPIQGMTALRRVGVSFTESQVAMITQMQKSGDLMGAQKMILSELQSEFGGAAKAAGDTFAGAIAKAQNKVDNFKESVGQGLAAGLLLVTGDMKGAIRTGLDLQVVTAKGAQLFTDMANMAKLDASEVGHLTAEQSAARTEMQHLSQQTTIQATAFDSAAAAGSRAAFAERGLEEAMRKLNDQMRQSWALANQAAGGLVGLVSAESDATSAKRDLAAAQAKVNTLTANGKQGTDAYRQAVQDRNAAELQSIQSQQNLEGQAQSLYAEFRKGNVTLAEAEDRLRAQAAAAGLSTARTNDLIGRVDALYAADKRIPSDVVTNFSAPGLDSQMSQLVNYWTTLKNIPTHKDVYIVTHYSTVGTPGTAGGPQ